MTTDHLNKAILLKKEIDRLTEELKKDLTKRTQLKTGYELQTIWCEVKGRFRNEEKRDDKFQTNILLTKEDLLRAVERNIFKLENHLFVAKKKLEEL